MMTGITDRCVTFPGVNCDGQAREIMALVDRHLAISGRNTPFRDYFAKKRAAGSGPKPDDPFLIHSNLQEVRGLFETRDDEEALSLLDQLEEKCC